MGIRTKEILSAKSTVSDFNAISKSIPKHEFYTATELDQIDSQVLNEFTYTLMIIVEYRNNIKSRNTTALNTNQYISW